MKTDILVIGGGLAGLYAAFCASCAGARVALVTQTTLKESTSYWAQGGIAAAVDAGDSTVLHKRDTLKAGCGLCVREAVDALVCEGRERVMEMARLGMKFDSHESGFELGLEGGHSKRRVLHAGGASTGKEMVEFLISSLEKSPGVNLIERAAARSLISDGHSCAGAWTASEKNGQIPVIARSTILATGGAAALFERTTNPQGVKGEGIWMAYNAGAEIMDMEFVQFHPTAFYSPDGESFLLSEALRGEGGFLVDANGKRFMETHHPLGDLAPRDAVSKAICAETGRSGENFVLLDLTRINPEIIKKRFSVIRRRCLENGVDCLASPVPVAPAAHYTIGGVKTGLAGETKVKGLYCCGETACSGVHGANRLASNSLLECLVFSKRSADGAMDNCSPPPKISPADFPPPAAGDDGAGSQVFEALSRQAVSKSSSLLGVVRNGPKIKNFIAELEKIRDRSSELDGWRARKIASMTGLCLMMSRAALVREESRGVHIRDDFPDADPRLCAHSVFSKDPSGGENLKLEQI